MKLRNAFSALLLAATIAIPVLGVAQHRSDLERRLTIHKERLPRPSHRLLVVHPRRLAFKQGHEKRQYRFLSHKQHHQVRQDVRSVAHHVTAPHHPHHR